VVRHQTIRVNNVPVLLPIPHQAFHIGLIIAIRKKSSLLLVSSNDDVIEHTSGKQSWSASHDV
jgi:hypothetical protein